MKLLIVVGDDKIGREAINKIVDIESVNIILDKSTSMNRVFRLIINRRMPMLALLKMIVANIFRHDVKLKNKLACIRSNLDLLNYIDTNTTIILFRAGLIVNKNVINSSKEILNVHCAKVPEYGGIASIYKALSDKSYNQEASLHKVIEKIDEGEVYDVEPYVLDEKSSYLNNENIAYQAGYKLLVRTIRRIIK